MFIPRLKILLAVVLFALTSAVPAAELDGRVVGVTDGDTIVVLNAAKQRYTIRLATIDAPEYSQPFGRRSKQNLSQLIYGKAVSVAFRHRDRWGRLVGIVYLNGQDVNLKQVLDGCAWYNPRYSYEQQRTDRGVYTVAQADARKARRGLWGDRDPVPPWKWRRMKQR